MKSQIQTMINFKNLTKFRCKRMLQFQCLKQQSGQTNWAYPILYWKKTTISWLRAKMLLMSLNLI